MTLVDPDPLAPTAAALRRGDLTPAQYLNDRCDRAEAVEPEVHALLPEADRRDRLAREAAALEERHPFPGSRPPLYGIPVGVKDIFHVDGFPTKAGSDLPPTALAGPEADVVTALREAGAVTFGKTVTTEFAYFHPGPTRNPHGTAHTPGGSSSGSAAAVAAGECPLALGSQTVGSTIRPAAFCGIVGFKPSYDRISRAGVIPLSTSVDHVGLFTPDVAGMRLAASVACRDWDPGLVPDDTPALGVPTGPYLDQAEPRAVERFEGTLDALRAAGYAVERVPVLDDVDELNDRHDDLVAADAAIAHQEWYEAYGDRYAERTAALVEEGRAVEIGRVAAARQSRFDLRADLESALAERGLDLFVCPAAPGPAPEGIESTGDPRMNLPWTHAGMPAATVPAGRVDGLPIGLQVVAPFGRDEALLAWAEGMEAAVGGDPAAG